MQILPEKQSTGGKNRRSCYTYPGHDRPMQDEGLVCDFYALTGQTGEGHAWIAGAEQQLDGAQEAIEAHGACVEPANRKRRRK
jgi:hypothetical protein